jgi:hypothetical protein
MRNKPETVNEALVKALVETNANLLRYQKKLQDAVLLIAEHQIERVKWELSVEQASAMAQASRGTPAARAQSNGRTNRVDALDDDRHEIPFGEDDVT